MTGYSNYAYLRDRRSHKNDIRNFEIVYLYEFYNWTIKRIASEYGITYQAIRDIIKRNS